MKETFEFWCSSGGGGCGGYFRVRLRRNIDGDYTVVCPKCKHKHNRRVKKGQITAGRCNGAAGDGKTEEILVPMSAYSKEPVLEASARNETSTKLETKRKQTEGQTELGSRLSILWGRFSGRKQ